MQPARPVGKQLFPQRMQLSHLDPLAQGKTSELGCMMHAVGLWVTAEAVQDSRAVHLCCCYEGIVSMCTVLVAEYTERKNR